jgi:Dimethlysulfonioproprionate lyase
LLASLGEPSVEPWLADWPTASAAQSGAPVRPAAAPLPVLQWLPHAAQAAPAFGAELCMMLADAAADLEWRQTYGQADVASGAIGAGFLDRYGWCEVIGARAAMASDRMACGFLLLGPDTHYPSHRHEAEELYLPLSGSAAWRQANGESDGEWRQRPPGTLIHHASFESHAMRTGVEPLLALYIWRGGNVNAKTSFLRP